MGVIRLYKVCEEVDEIDLRRVKSTLKTIVSVHEEFCYYIETSDAVQQCDTLEKLSENVGNVMHILGDVHTNSQLSKKTSEEMLVEIGPRLNFTTAFSTNAVNICHAADMTKITRLERSRRFLIKSASVISETTRKEVGLSYKVVMALHDPLTEQEYKFPMVSMTPEKEPETWSVVDVISSGRLALEEVNTKMGLQFDDWDLQYYTDLFQNKIQRNPTTVELFDLAQSNSEHSRHWFFKGKYYLEGKELPSSLFDIVMNTISSPTTNKNNVIAFSDNSSGIKGWNTTAIVASDPTQVSQLVLKEVTRHLIFTAETHNFPTGVAPFSGATTGTGGRIRDVQAAGRGGHVVAGTAGYCFGNLFIPGYSLPWEKPAEYPPNFATPLEVAIEASNGASDYGNKFGEPVLAGFSRSYGNVIGEEKAKERREWIKPIMFSGGMGVLDEDMITKDAPEKGNLVVKVGGPVYRIGVGGGAASSVQVQGDNTATRDLGAVQRGDAEMEQKVNRVIRGCTEMRPNPILAIHDQGAGGNANVLKEIMEGSGGEIYSKSFSVGDPTLSTLEVWGAEYQESNAVLIKKEDLGRVSRLAKRERCPIDTVGVITNDKRVRLIEDKLDLETVDSPSSSSARSEDKRYPVDLDLEWVLGKMPRKEFHWTESCITSPALMLPKDTTIHDALERVLRLPSVASKQFLTNKVDRSVTGLVAQQQCVGPLHIPLSDVAVTAHSYFHKEGTATSIGEQPIKMLVNPSAGARISVLEALSNLVAAPISDIKDVKCSANWMWPAKMQGEGWSMYKACEAMSAMMVSLGIAVDGGKDSLSMAARVKDDKGESSVVKCPGSLVISAYAPCTDVSKVVTPDLKGPSRHIQTSLIWVRPMPTNGKLAGTSLAQVYGQLGRETLNPSPEEALSFRAAFITIQELIKDEAVLSIHDISDGGFITCLFEMGMAGLGGFSVNLKSTQSPPQEQDIVPPQLAILFSEEVGWIMELDKKIVPEVMEKFAKNGVEAHDIGVTTSTGPTADMIVKIVGEEVVKYSISEALKTWGETSYQLECLQMNPDCAKSEFDSVATRKDSPYVVKFDYKDFSVGSDLKSLSKVRVGLIREEGSNGDREMAAALLHAGFEVYDITMSDMINNKIDLFNYKGVIFPGGFSYADVLGSGCGWAASILLRQDLSKMFKSWKSDSSTFSLGVCNGCQLMAHLGWINPMESSDGKPVVRLGKNNSCRFESRWSRVKIESSKSIWMKNMENSQLGVWVAHSEGRFQFKNQEVYSKLESSSCIAMRYVDDDGSPTEIYPMNPNGSLGGVAGITSECGRHLAIMPHPERCFMQWQWPHLSEPLLSPPFNDKSTAPWSKIFQNAYDWSVNH